MTVVISQTAYVTHFVPYLSLQDNSRFTCIWFFLWLLSVFIPSWWSLCLFILVVFTAHKKELCVEIVTVQDLLLTAEYAQHGVRISIDLNWNANVDMNTSWPIHNKNSEMKHSFIRPPKAMGLNTTELPPEKQKHWKTIKQRKIIDSLCLQWR